MNRFFVHPDIAQASTIDTDIYTDAELYKPILKRIFETTWQYVGHHGYLKGNNSVFPLSLLHGSVDEPLVVTKDGEGKVRCLSNVCTHRGNILAVEACSTPHLRCKYHGRRFSLDGKFSSMPEFKEVQNFPTAADDLHSLPLHEFGPWFFTNLIPGLDPELFFCEMKKRLSFLPLQEFTHRPERKRVFEVKANWALYCENYLEGFHIPFVHAGLNEVIDFGDYTTEVYQYSNLQLGIAKGNDDVFDLPVDSPDYGKKVAAYYYWVFPNMMFNFYPWGLSFNLVEPLGMNRTRVTFETFVWKEELYNKGAGSDLDTVEMEDEEIVEWVQQGVRSRFYRKGRYSVTREQGTHHFHRLLASFMS